jgi:hypothetical protein
MLIRCERKILLADRWLVAGADLMLEKSTAAWLAPLLTMWKFAQFSTKNYFVSF